MHEPVGRVQFVFLKNVQLLIYPSPFPLVRKYIREAMIFLFGSSEVACKAGGFTCGKEIGLPSQQLTNFFKQRPLCLFSSLICVLARRKAHCFIVNELVSVVKCLIDKKKIKLHVDRKIL